MKIPATLNRNAHIKRGRNGFDGDVDGEVSGSPEEIDKSECQQNGGAALAWTVGHAIYAL